MTEQKCIFCQIIAGELKANIVKDNRSFVVLHDLLPQAPCHLLIIPKQHYSDITECKDKSIIADMLNEIPQLLSQQGINSGFRLVINTGKDGGQTIPHLHIHLLGGRDMKWPPG